MPLTSTFTLTSTADQTAAALDFTTPSAPLSRTYPIPLSSGTGAGQADKLWHDQRTLTASSSEDLDLAGTLTDPFGATITFARIKGIIIAAAAANTNNVIVGNATSNGFVSWVGGAAHTVTVRPGGFLALFAPDATAYTVTAATADLLHVANSAAGTSVTYDVVLVGASA